MKRTIEHVDVNISSDESSSADEAEQVDVKPERKQPTNSNLANEPSMETMLGGIRISREPEVKQINNGAPDSQLSMDKLSEGEIFTRAKIYQEYMRKIRIPSHRGSVIPFTSWMGLARAMKQLYGQPLHYLTNILLRQWDQSRFGAEDENRRLDSIIDPRKAEASIWIIEEVHRMSSSHQYLAKLWMSDPMYHAFVDSIFPQL